MVSDFKSRLYEIVFEADTKAGKTFDIVLLIFIILSIVTVSLESIKSVSIKYSKELATLEWIITILFALTGVGRKNIPHRFVPNVIPEIMMLRQFIAQNVVQN